MAAQGKIYPDADHLFSGRWMPGESRIKVGPDNLSAVKNVRPTDTGFKPVPGYSKINDTLLTTHPVMKSGVQVKNAITGDSHVLVQAENAGGSESAVYKNLAVVPAQGDFAATVLHTDDASAGRGRFCNAPGGEIVYANGKETLVYGSGAMPVRGFIASSAVVGDFASDAVDHTDQVNSPGESTGELAVIGGGNDSDTTLLLHFDGADGATTTADSSTGGSGAAVTLYNNAKLETDVSKFGASCLQMTGGISSLPVYSVDYASVAHGGGDFNFGSNPFTIDFWVRFPTTKLSGPPTYFGLFIRQTDEDNYWGLFYLRATNALIVKDLVSGSSNMSFSTSWTPAENTWYHMALIRGWSGDGDTWAICVNGNLQGFSHQETGYNPTNFDTTPLTIGRFHVTSYPQIHYAEMQIDEYRITKGVARWTEAFTPPASKFGTSRMNFVVVSSRALSGIKPYVKNVNTASSPVITGSFWSGAAFSPLSLTDGSNGLADSDEISFPTTVGEAKPRYLEGYFGYCYQFNLSAGAATLSRVTVNAPLQPITDVWNGVWRTAIQFRYSIAGVDYDRTLDVAEMTPSGITAFADSYTANLQGLTATDYIDIGFADRMCGIRLWTWDREAGYVNTAAAVATIYIWDGAEFIPCTGILDGTDVSGDSIGQQGVVSWDPTAPGQEYKKESAGIKLYIYRIKFSATITGTTGIGIDMVQGISAPEPRLAGCDLPFFFQNRVFLVSGNKAHYCETGEPAFWNGEDSSFSPYRKPVEFGDGTDVKAAVSIFNRFGSGMLFYAVILKEKGIHLLSGYDADTFQVQDVSDKIGIVAVMTLDAAEVAYRLDDARRNLVIWLSYTGPIIFDAGTPIQARGDIACYFDKDDDRCVNYAAIDTSWGILDPDTNTYHLCIPTGSATTPNTWLALDLVRDKWYLVVPAGDDCIPRGAFRVTGATGAQYVYLMMADGRLLRMNHSRTWDGEDIDWYLETGDFIPTGRIMDISKSQRISLLMESVTQAAATVDVTHYLDGSDSGTLVKSMSAYHAGKPYVLDTKKINKGGLCHRLRFASLTNATLFEVPLVGWNMSFEKTRKHGGG